MSSSIVRAPAQVILAVSILGSAAAQFPLPLEQVRAGGHGAIQLSFDAETQVSNDLLLGCAYLNDVYYVSGRNSAGPFHNVYKFDATGTSIGQFTQIESPTTTDWGYRDGATDGTSLMFGSENGVFVIDTDGNPETSVVTANGTQFLGSNPIGGAALTLLGTFRGVAYDPNGNGGDGSLWAGNFGSSLVEFDLDGVVLREIINPGVSVYGLAMDPDAGSLWVSTALNGDIVELDLATGDPTSAAIPRYNASSSPGGLARGPGNATFASLDQASPDRLTVYRNHIRPVDVLGKLEERLLTSINDGPFLDAQFRPVATGATVDFLVTGNTFAGALNATVFNFGAPAAINGSTSIGGVVLPELVALSDSSTPMGMGVLVPSSNGVSGRGVIPPDFLPDGTMFRMQGLHILPSPALIATNQVYMTYAGPAGGQVRVEAVGTNSLNSDSATGFFRVTHLGNGPAIERVVMSWVGSPNPAQATMEWDTDSIDLDERFDGGNSTVIGCRGTYRNSSDVATGLIYTTSFVSPCDPTAQTGWVGSDPGGSTGDWRTLTFDFTPGEFIGGRMLEFDCDTDGGQGINGADMEGMRVTVHLTGGAMLSDILSVDPASSTPRSFVDL